MSRALLTISALALLLPSPAPACTFCAGINPNTLTLRYEVAQAKLVLYGTLANARLNPGTTAGGSTDLKIEYVLKDDPFLAGRKVITLPRFVPFDAKNPPKFLVFCDIFQGKLGPYRGTPARSAAIVEYIRGASKLDPKDRAEALLYFFQYLENPDADIARDAFVEFAKASDEEVGKVAHRFSPAKIGIWLEDPNTKAERLTLYSFMLGASGSDAEAAVLERMLKNPTERTVASLGGILAGYIQLRPAEGWNFCHALLRDAKRPFLERFGALGTLRFFHGWKPDDSRRDVLRGLSYLVEQGDIADLAVEDLRRWQYWDLTDKVLAQWGKKSHDAPIMKRTLVRYGLSCPQSEAKRFIEQIRKQDGDMVREVEDSLQFEKK
jgi:hypothetical protein